MGSIFTGWQSTIAIIVSSLLLLSAVTKGEDEPRTTLCVPYGISALGMESGDIPNEALSASSSYSSENVGPLSARLNKDYKNGAWCPETLISSQSNEWIQVNFSRFTMTDFVITGVATSGRYSNGNGAEYTEAIMLNYTRDGVNWIPWTNFRGERELVANEDVSSVRKNVLDVPMVGVRGIRVIPTSAGGRTSCLRFELYGCPYKMNGPISYSMSYPEEDTSLGPLSDETYDGYETRNGTMLEGGIGQLVDGIEGADDLHYEANTFDWVAWKANDQLIFQFEFKTIQNFTSATFHAHHILSQGIDVFKMAHIWFSINGQDWSHTPEMYEHVETRVANSEPAKSRYVKIMLHNLVGKFIKFHFKLSSKWLLLSEVHFESETISRPLTTSELAFYYPIETKKDVEPPTSLQQNQLMIIIVSCVALLLTITIFIIFLMTRKPKSKDKSELEYASIPVKPTTRVAPYGEIYRLDNRVPMELHYNREDPDYAVPDAIETNSGGYNANTRCLLQWPHGNRAQSPHGNFYQTSGDDNDDGEAKYYASTDVLSGPPRLPEQPKILSHKPNNYQLNNQAELVSSPLLSSFYKPNTEVTNKVNAGPLAKAYFHQQQQHSAEKIISSIVNVALHHSIPLLKETDINIIDGQFGYSKFGDCELGFLDQQGVKSLIILKTLAKVEFEEEFTKEMVERWRLSSQCRNSFASFHGCITKHDYLAVAFEFGDMDLKKFLQTCPMTSISFNVLMSIAYQIAEGMQDLHSKGFVHRDLAARNVLIYTSNMAVKVTDAGASMAAYKDEYYQEILPIRWMSFESVVNSDFTKKGDVYSFGVTLWEIVSFCHKLPHSQHSDEEIVELFLKAKDNLETQQSLTSNTTTPMTFYNQPFNNDREGLSLRMLQLKKPSNCPADVYNLMLKCCQLDERSRPEFHDIAYLISQKLNL